MASDERHPSKEADWREMDEPSWPRAIFPVCYQCGRITAEWWGFFNTHGVAKAICRRCIEEKPN